jgi:glucose-6-phosphate 1-dehydrogenase
MKPNYLIIQIQPDEGMWFDFQAKKPGTTLEIDNIQMGFAYSDFFKMQPSTGYETLLYDCMIGDQTLFQRADNIENGWRAVQPFLDAWKGCTDVHLYAAGSDGPDAADELLRRDGRAWHSLK